MLQMSQVCDFTSKLGQFNRLKAVEFNFDVFTIFHTSAGDLSQLSAEISKILNSSKSRMNAPNESIF